MLFMTTGYYALTHSYRNTIMKYKCYIDQPSKVIKIKLALIIRTFKSQLSVS